MLQTSSNIARLVTNVQRHELTVWQVTKLGCFQLTREIDGESTKPLKNSDPVLSPEIPL